MCITYIVYPYSKKKQKKQQCCHYKPSQKRKAFDCTSSGVYNVCKCVCVCVCVCVCMCISLSFLNFILHQYPAEELGHLMLKTTVRLQELQEQHYPVLPVYACFSVYLLCCYRDYPLLLPGQAGKPLLFFDFQLPRGLLHVGPEAHGPNTTFTRIQGTKYQVQCLCQTRRYSAEPGSTQEQSWISTVWNISQWMWSQDVSATVSPKWLC